MKKSFSLLSVALAALALLSGGVGAFAFPGGGGGAGPGGVSAAGGSTSAEVFRHVERFYVEPGRAVPARLIGSALSNLEAAYPEILASVDEHAGQATLEVDGKKGDFSFQPEGSLLEVAAFLDGVVDFAAEHLPLPVDVEKLRYEALRGGLMALDPHSQLFDSEQLRGFQTRTRGSFGGVGFTFILSEAGISIRRIIPGTPAEEVGLMAGDMITAVDGAPVQGLTTAETVGLVRGEPGTVVVLTVSRDAWDEPRDLNPVRAVIRSRSVRSEVFTDEGERGVAYVKIDTFQEETSKQLQEALESAGDGVAGVILDLRGNPGGLLDQAVSSTDIFLDSGVIVSTRDRSGGPRVHRASMFGIVRRQLPLVVLINRMSSSASEVMAAALKESRAVVIGETSFGKGSVQQTYPLSDGGGLLLTIRHYFTPGDVSIQSTGVTPDVLLFPVVVGEKVFLGEPSVHRREGALKNAFAHRGGEPHGEEPAWTIEYLRESTTEISKGHRGGAGAGGGSHLRGEIAVKAALMILRKAADGKTGPSRAGLLESTGAVLEEVETLEAARIREALAGRGIEWTRSPETGGGRPVLEVELPEELILEAGATAGVTVRVRNTGGGAAYRVWGRSSSENPFLSNLDFLFGTIPPGASQEVTVDLPVPAWAWQRWDTWDLAVEEGDGREAGTFRGIARTSAGIQPSVAYAVRLSDGDGGDPGRDGDGVLSPGEHLTVRILATGEGERLDLRVTPRRPGKVSVGKRDATLRPQEGDEGKAAFDLRLLDGEGLDTLDLDLVFRSGSFGQVLEDSLSVPVESPYRAREVRSPPQVEIVEDLPEKTRSSRVTLSIEVTDEGSVKDVHVLLAGKKILYRRNERPGSGSLPLDLEVELADGSNRIDVVARDGSDLVTVRTFFVYRLAA